MAPKRQGHGTAACGRRGCQQEACREAFLAQNRRWAKLHKMGRSAPKLPVEPVYEYLHWLHDERKMSLPRIAKVSGVHYQQVQRIHDKNSVRHPKFLSPRVSASLLAVRPDPAFVPTQASVIRINMAALYGWGQIEFGHLVGQRQSLRLSPRPTVTVSMAERVIEALRYAIAHPRENSCIPKARNRGVRPATDYDRDLLFDPYWDGRDGLLPVLTAADVLDDFDWLLEQGLARKEAAMRLGFHLDTLTTAKRRQVARVEAEAREAEEAATEGEVDIAS